MLTKNTYDHYRRDGQLPDPGLYPCCPYCRTELVLKEIDHKQRAACPDCGFVQFRNPAPTVSVLIIDDQRVLLGRRANEPGKGTWSVPSGYVEWEDDWLTTAVSEAREETGLDIEVLSLLDVVSSFVSARFHFVGLYAVARVVGGRLIAGDDLDAVEWFPLAGPLPEMGFQEDRDMIERCRQERG